MPAKHVTACAASLILLAPDLPCQPRPRWSPGRRARPTPPPRSAASGCRPPIPSSAGSSRKRPRSPPPGGPRASCRRAGAPNVLLIMTDDEGFGAPSTFGGVIPTPDAGPHREERAAVHQLPLHLALLADPRGADHRAQPPHRRLRRGGRDRDRVPGLRLVHPAEDRPPSAGSSRRTGTPPRGSARTTTRRSTRRPRPGRSTSGLSGWASSTSTASSGATPASGSRTSSGTPRRSTPSWTIRTGT